MLEIMKKTQETMRLVDAERMTMNRLENRIKTESRKDRTITIKEIIHTDTNEPYYRCSYENDEADRHKQ